MIVKKICVYTFRLHQDLGYELPRPGDGVWVPTFRGSEIPKMYIWRRLEPGQNLDGCSRRAQIRAAVANFEREVRVALEGIGTDEHCYLAVDKYDHCGGGFLLKALAYPTKRLVCKKFEKDSQYNAIS